MVIVDDENSRSASECAAAAREGEIGGSAGATIHLWLRSNGRRHGYDDDDTVGAGSPDGYDRPRWRGEEQIRSEVLLRNLEVLVPWYELGAGRLEDESRGAADVSNRALGGALRLTRTGLQRLQPLSHSVRPKVEVGAVPGGNAAPEDDRLRRGVDDPDSFRDVPRQQPGMNHIDEVDRYVVVQPPQRAYFLVGDTAGRTDGTVLVDDCKWLRERGNDVRLSGDLVHVKT